MTSVAVISKTGKRLMPTSAYRARKLLKAGKATVEKYSPIFTIRLTEREDGAVQSIELKCDSGSEHIGISIASATKEYVDEQRDLLPDEKKKHDKRRKYRRERRNRLRYRKARFSNRKGKICEDGFAPSIRNKRDVHVKLISDYAAVMPITDIYIEVGQFDIQVLAAVEAGKPIPQGEDYSKGERYGFSTLREAVFSRDGYKCICCKKSAFGKNGVILHVHHLGFKTGDHSDRMGNLATVCTTCHTSANHKPDGVLYDLKPKLKTFKGAAFMNTVKWSLYEKVKAAVPDAVVHLTYGAATKLARSDLGLPKSHANDAFSMGKFHPKHRTEFHHYVKRRRNNRTLEKFYDAKYTDCRDGKKKSGSQLSCGRTNRREQRYGQKNMRIYRGPKISKGHRNIRKKRYDIQSGDTVKFKGSCYISAGVHCTGSRVQIIMPDKTTKSVPRSEVQIVKHAGGYKEAI